MTSLNKAFDVANKQSLTLLDKVVKVKSRTRKQCNSWLYELNDG